MTQPRSKLISKAFRRGLRKRCPHCGEGQLFSGWSHFESCSVCGLVYSRNPGDTWAFTIVGDRLPIAATIVLIYFGVMRSYLVLGLTMMVLSAALVVWTAPNRGARGSRSTTYRECIGPIPRIPSRRPVSRSSAVSAAQESRPTPGHHS